MQAETDVPAYRIWGTDNVIYGPVALPTLVNWVREQRVTAATWIHVGEEDRWQKAADISQLQMFFKPKSASGPTTLIANPQGDPLTVSPGSLRRMKVFTGMSDEQIKRFFSLMEIQEVRPWAEIIRQGSPGDAMYLILEGEVRVRLMIAGKESILTTLSEGEFFGEVALFDHGPRSADVIAN